MPFVTSGEVPAGAATFIAGERLRSVLQHVFGSASTNSRQLVGPIGSGRSSLVRQLNHPTTLALIETARDALIAEVFPDRRRPLTELVLESLCRSP